MKGIPTIFEVVKLLQRNQRTPLVLFRNGTVGYIISADIDSYDSHFLVEVEHGSMKMEEIKRMNPVRAYGLTEEEHKFITNLTPIQWGQYEWITLGTPYTEL